MGRRMIRAIKIQSRTICELLEMEIFVICEVMLEWRVKSIWVKRGIVVVISSAHNSSDNILRCEYFFFTQSQNSSSKSLNFSKLPSAQVSKWFFMFFNTNHCLAQKNVYNYFHFVSELCFDDSFACVSMIWRTTSFEDHTKI